MADYVISLTASLVREYLSRKGLKSTLQTLDKEMPRSEDSISNRAQLAKEMHIEKLMKKNKELPEPFRTMLEVMVKSMKDQGDLRSLSSSGTDSRTNQRPNSARETKKDSRSRSAAQPTNNDLINELDKHDDKDDRKDYDDLLKRLEKPARNAPVTKPSLLSNDLKTKVSAGDGTKHVPVAKEYQSSTSPATPVSSSDVMAKLKGKRRLNNTIGGPVISSGLAGKRDPRSRHSTGRLSSSSGAKDIGSLFADDDESKDLGVAQFQKLDTQDKNADALNNVQDVPLDQIGKDQQQLAEVSLKQSKKGSSHKSSTRNQPVSNSRSQKSRSNDLVFEDVDEDFDQDLGQLSLGPKKIASVDVQSKPISLEIAMGLKNLIFGTATTSFTPEWRNQSFSFCDLFRLEYGIVQLKGGPCGVLAAVQGFILKHLLFGGKKGDTKKKAPTIFTRKNQSSHLCYQ